MMAVRSHCVATKTESYFLDKKSNKTGQQQKDTASNTLENLKSPVSRTWYLAIEGIDVRNTKTL